MSGDARFAAPSRRGVQLKSDTWLSFASAAFPRQLASDSRSSPVSGVSRTPRTSHRKERNEW
jgi:hypothetical protein